jgi:hypothetical protein
MAAFVAKQMLGSKMNAVKGNFYKYINSYSYTIFLYNIVGLFIYYTNNIVVIYLYSQETFYMENNI